MVETTNFEMMKHKKITTKSNKDVFVAQLNLLDSNIYINIGVNKNSSSSLLLLLIKIIHHFLLFFVAFFLLLFVVVVLNNFYTQRFFIHPFWQRH